MFSVVSSVAAASLLATLCFASLCLCSDEPMPGRSFLEDCGPAAQGHVEVAPLVEASGDACLGPCVDVRTLAAGALGDYRPPAAAAMLVAAPHGSVGDRPQPVPLRARTRDNRPSAEHLDYTILRC